MTNEFHEHIIYSYFRLEDSYARYHLETALECSIPDFLNSLIGMSAEESDIPSAENEVKWAKFFRPLEQTGKLIGRSEEIAKILRVLCRKTRSNVLISGGRGVGKTALAKGLAAMLEKGEVPAKLTGYEMMELNIGMLLSGAQYRGDLEGAQSLAD